MNQEIVSGAKKPLSKKRKIIYGSILGLGVLIMIISNTGNKSSANQATPAVSNFSIGDTAYLRSSADPIFVPTTKDNFDRTMQLSVAGDTAGIAQMVLDGQVLSVKNGTQVKVIGESFTSSDVRIMNGDFAGQSGFVPNEFVKMN